MEKLWPAVGTKSIYKRYKSYYLNIQNQYATRIKKEIQSNFDVVFLDKISMNQISRP